MGGKARKYQKVREIHAQRELYEYTITNTPTKNLRVVSIDDNRLKDDDLVLAIGKASAFGLKGLRGLDANEWYRNI